MMSTAFIGGIAFEEAPRDFGRAYVIEPKGLKGWFEGVAVRREDVARPVAHGSFPAPAYGSVRVVSITGNIIAPTPEALEHMRNALTGLLSEGGMQRLSVEGPTGMTWADVGLAAQTMVDEAETGLEAAFQVQFWAPDPLRYGRTNEFGPGASVVAHHYGNTAASPVLEVTGSSPGGYTITGPGDRLITVTRALWSTEPHTIDLASGGLYEEGERVLGGISVYQPWTIPAGQAVTVSTSTGQVAVKVRDTFV